VHSGSLSLHPFVSFPHSISPMLRDLQTYITTHGTVSLADLSMHFHTNDAALKPMLNKLSRKGRIRKLPTTAQCHCNDCTCCNLSSLEFYEWIKP
jgi:putative ferrous iron transport protein C